MQVRTQNHTDRPQEGPENESDAQLKVIPVCKLDMHITDWVKVQSEDQYILIVMRWIEDKKRTSSVKCYGTCLPLLKASPTW